MSSSLFNVGRLDRKFVQESAGTPQESKLKYNDPTFVTFRILFDFEPLVSSDEVTQGLLLDESRDESAISYLRRMGDLERSEALKEFIWLLSRISNDFPWYFKSITGLQSLWKWGFIDDQGKTEAKPVDIDIECFETVDFRITALSDLYRKATRDRRFFRELLTIDKKRFNMTIIVGEARNLRTFTGSNETQWLKNVSAVAFRCLDCEFDFSEAMVSSSSATDAPKGVDPKISIKVHRVQETNSYNLLNYMLGEIKRDLIIKQGGSGAEVNAGSDIIDYRSLLSPFVRSYEGDYSRVLADLNNNINQNFLNRLNLRTGDRRSSLSYQALETLNRQELDGISKQEEIRVTSQLLTSSSIQLANITNEPSLIEFGVPTVNEELSERVDLVPENIEETLAQQIEFTKPKVETELPDFSFNRPGVETNLEENVGFIKPSVQRDISSGVSLNRPSVGEKTEDKIIFVSPKVETKSDDNVGLARPTVNTDIDSRVRLEPPTVDTNIEQIVSFGRPTEQTEIDAKLTFVKPAVEETISEKITFEKPKVEDEFRS